MGIGLGPVARIVDYDPRWPRQFKEEKARILAAIGPWARSVEHVGSTAVPGLAAKPIIDILVGLRSLEDAKECITRLEAIGYEYIPEYEAIRPERRYFRKGPTESRTHHLHMVETSSGFFRNYILFRDYLRAHPADARQYEDLKRALAQEHEFNRDAYTEGKTEYVEYVLAKATHRRHAKRLSGRPPSERRMWNQEERLRQWFYGLSPGRRLEVALEFERFRREAWIVRSRGRARSSK